MTLVLNASPEHLTADIFFPINKPHVPTANSVSNKVTYVED